MWEQIRANKNKSIFLAFFILGILLLIGLVFGEFIAPGGGTLGIAAAIILWVILSLISYFQGGNIMLAISGARKIEHADHPMLFNIVEEMKIASGLPKAPDVYIIDDPSPNAFATGRDAEHSAVAVTSGLLNILNRDELQGVIAHEMGHIKNRDILFMIMIGIMLGVIVLMSDIFLRSLRWGGGRSRRSSGGGQAQALILVIGLVLAILAPIVAQLIYFAISRRREYLADASGALFTRYPEGLASALEKIGASSGRYQLQSANRATAPMYIINPLKAEAASLSATHPPIEERVKILRSMAGGAGYVDFNAAWKKVTRSTANIIPASGLKSLQSVALRGAIGAEAKPEPTKKERVRQTTDLLWSMSNYIFITCLCGTKMKIPPTFSRPEIQCPHCGRMNTLTKPQK
ncbi:MAG: M48 family metallopeptidase [Planctomycetes bacterium]|nr:M48 family metallopeptidase [Planctomycetota bacterium]